MSEVMSWAPLLGGEIYFSSFLSHDIENPPEEKRPFCFSSCTPPPGLLMFTMALSSLKRVNALPLSRCSSSFINRRWIFTWLRGLRVFSGSVPPVVDDSARLKLLLGPCKETLAYLGDRFPLLSCKLGGFRWLFGGAGSPH